MAAPATHTWDLFCRVIDNFGDAGVCWRLAAQLAAAGDRVRLVIDDAAPLAWMAPQGARGVDVLPWPGPAEPGDVVVEAFGCDPPPAFVQAMAASRRPPVWINLEYLSAEPYVERSHGLPSPQASGLTKWFFFPGFSQRTGGLLRESGLESARATFDAAAWLRGRGIERAPGERLASLLCYASAALGGLMHRLAQAPTRLLLTAGAPAQAEALARAAGLRTLRLPWLSQPDYDHLLWSCELNFVRGEDSLVRALWAGAPFVWQAYPQHDGAHHAKVQAMLASFTPAPDVAALWRAWNGMGAPGAAGLPAALPAAGPWREATRAWRARLLAQSDLLTRLRAFVAARA
jgi:uncharacterized repeat protein (TIGR03837 family)